jgi:hypothetical protein
MRKNRFAQQVPVLLGGFHAIGARAFAATGGDDDDGNGFGLHEVSGVKVWSQTVDLPARMRTGKGHSLKRCRGDASYLKVEVAPNPILIIMRALL